MLRNNVDARRCLYFELGLPVVVQLVRIVPLVRAPSRDFAVWVLDNPQKMVSPSTKLQLLAKAKKNWGERPVPEGEAWGGARAPFGTLKMPFLFFRFFNEKWQKYCDLRDGPFYFWGGWGCSITEKFLRQRSKRKKSCTRKYHLGASLISFVNDISNC